MIDYLLVVLTHGTHPRHDSLEETLESFYNAVSPRPAGMYLHQDGEGSPHFYRGFPTPMRYEADLNPQLGFCGSTAKAWAAACESELPHVFWLEHDFRFLRDIDLDPLEQVIFRDRTLAQMSLMRNAVSPEEIAASGLYEMRREEYHAEPEGWLSHRSYFTTNPSLMRTAWMRTNPFIDDGEPHCEGRFGIDVVKRGFRYGVWGDGEPWVEHIGTRTGFGY